MSRPIGVIGEYTPFDIDREAMMMDGGRLFFQLTVEDSGGGGGTDGGDGLREGILLQDSQGGIWTVVGSTGHSLRNNQTGQVMSVYNAVNALGPYFLTETGRAIQITASPSALPTFTELSLQESGNLFPSGGTGGGGGGGAAPAFSSTAAGVQQDFENQKTLLGAEHENNLTILNTQLASAEGINAANIQAQIDLENLRHDNDLRELELQFENQLKTSIIGEIGAERRTLIQEKGALKRQLLELGPDPFKQAANISGQVTRGTTPQQVAVGQAQGFINQELPTLDFNATLPQLQAQLGTIQGVEAPTLAGGFGLPSLAHGGVIEMEKGKDGSFRQKQSFIVGEQGPEVLTVGDGKVEVTPFGGGASHGLSLDTQSASQSVSGLFGRRQAMFESLQSRLPGPSTAIDPLQQSAQQALAPLFGGLGLSGFNIPTIHEPTGETRVPGFGDLATLGVRPRLVRDLESGRIFFIGNDGVAHYVGDPAALAGIAPSDIIQALPHEIEKLAFGGFGAGITKLPSLFNSQGPQPAFQGLGTPLIEPTTGAALPAPFKIASELGQFSQERPDLFSNALSAFSAAGLTPASVIAMIEAATPTGASSRPRRLGFTGRTF